jgi:hypothetical protein
MFLGILFMLVGAAVVIVPIWKILQRLGYSPYLSLLVVLPFLNIGLLYFIAFTDWPVEPGAGPPEKLEQA